MEGPEKQNETATQAAQGAAGGARSRPGAGKGQGFGGGPPKGNRNSLLHGLTSEREQAKRATDPYWVAALAEADAMLDATGLRGNALGERLARRMAQTEYESAKLEAFCVARGRTMKTGALKPAYVRMLDLRSSDLAQCAKLIDKLAGLIGDTSSSYVDLIRLSQRREAAQLDAADATQGNSPAQSSASPGDAQGAGGGNNSRSNGEVGGGVSTQSPPIIPPPVTAETTDVDTPTTPKRKPKRRRKKQANPLPRILEQRAERARKRALHAGGDAEHVVHLDEPVDFFSGDDSAWVPLDLD